MNARHVSRSLWRRVKAPREQTWKVLHDLLAQAAGGYAVEGDPPPHGEGAVLHLRLAQPAEFPGLADPLVEPGPPSQPGPLVEPVPPAEPDPLVETVLSYEPPWRRACSVTGPLTGLDVCHTTFVLRDDADECHLSWGVVVDPEPTPQGWAFLEVAVATIDGLLDLVVAAAEQPEPS